MKALLLYIKGGVPSVEAAGTHGEIQKKFNKLRELPEGVQDAQLWSRDNGLERQASAKKLASRFPKKEVKVEKKEPKPAAKKTGKKG